MLSLSYRKQVARAVVLAVTFGAIAGTGCKKKVEPPPPPPPPQPVEVRLQVSSISPSAVEPGAAMPGKVFGAAFQSGASVTFVSGGETPAEGVQMLDSNTLGLTIPALAEGTYDVKVTNPSGESSTLRAGLTVRTSRLSCASVVVNFNFDDDGITSSARSILDGQQSCFQSQANSVRIEGHADERGTVDYNLALGQRRADSVKRHLTNAGVSAGKVSTTSFGEERPVASGHNEASWSQNRRAEITATR